MKIKTVSILLILVLFVTTSHCYSQKEYNNWYFGQLAGISFNTGVPIALLDGALYTAEGCASISDSSGSLLFYTDGVKVYNRMHQQMPWGFGLTGGSSSTQSALIIQKPLCNSVFYVFTCAGYALEEGLRYSVVDMNLDNGLGDVTEKNVHLLSYATEKLTAIRHSNGVDIWIIGHGTNNNWFYSWLLTHNGLMPIPVISASGNYFSQYEFAGYLKPSPRGDKILCAIGGENIYQLQQFDRSTGTVSNPVTISTPEHSPSIAASYGCEFSSDSKLIYTKNNISKRIYQYNVSNYDSLLIVNSIDSIGFFVLPTSPPSNATGALQMGPNGKIYLARIDKPYLACIHNPNLSGDSCQFEDSIISLNGKLCGIGLPNNPFTAPYIQYWGCYNGNYRFHLTDTTSYQHWDFGIPSLNSDTSDQANPSWTYSQPGVYVIRCIYLTDWNTLDTVVTTVYASISPDIISADTVFTCGQHSVSIHADPAFDKYQWSNGASDSVVTIDHSGQYFLTASDCYCPVTDSVVVVIVPPLNLNDTSFCPGDSIQLSVEGGNPYYVWSNGSTDSITTIHNFGTYSVTVTSGSCIRTDSLKVTPKALAVDLGGDTSFCQGKSVQLYATGGVHYLWSNGDTLPVTSVSEPGIFWIYVTNGNCQGSDTVEVTKIPISLDLGKDTLLCDGDQITLTAKGVFDHCIWQDQHQGFTQSIESPGIYSAYAVNQYCIAKDTIKVSPCGSIFFPNVFTPNNDQVNDEFKPKYFEISEYQLTVFNRWGSVVFSTHDINKGWDGKFNGNTCLEGTYFYHATYCLRIQNKCIEKYSNGMVTLLR